MLKAGVCKVNITPFLGGPMSGYAARDHGSERVHDELYAKALVLDDGKTTVALVTSDLIGIDRALSGEVRALVKSQLGLPESCVWLCGSHTHFGPHIYRSRHVEDSPYQTQDEAYIQVLVHKMASAIKQAYESRRPARLGSGRILAEGIHYNRRLIRDDGKVEMSLTLPPPYEGLAFGPVDREVGLLKVMGETEDDVIASVINFACHPVSSTDRMYELSADYPGYAMNLIEQVEGGVCLFALGCAGNLVPIQRKGRSKRQVGLSLGGVALKGLQWILATDDIQIRAARKEIILPVRASGSEEEMAKDITKAQAVLEAAQKRQASKRELTELGEAVRVAEAMPRWAKRFSGQGGCLTEIQAFRLGDIHIVGLPGEVFTELGMMVKKALAPASVLVVSLSNDNPGYIPIRQAFDEGGYESTVSAFAPGAGEFMVEEALKLVASLEGF